MISSGTPAIPQPSVTQTPGGRRVRILVLLLLLVGLLYVWWPPPARLAATSQRPAPLPDFFSQIRTEEQWMANDIGKNIAELLAFAATRKMPALAGMQFQSRRGGRPKDYVFEAKLRGHPASAPTQLTVANYFWSPENFTVLARQWGGEWSGGATSARSPVDQEMFLRLTKPTPDALVREDKRLSEALTKFPLDAELHEEAALLIGSFALRHAAAAFYDVRRELSRMTAHLAVARALSGQSGPSGDLAEAILCTLVGRQSAALEILQRLERNAGTAAGLPLAANTIWNRALALRNTGDYRKLDQPEHASLLERLEYLRALRSRVDSSAASAFLMTFDVENLAEWSNIVLAAGFSVSEGHLWAPRAMRAEVEEAAAAYRLYHGRQLEKDEWSSALNAPAEHITQEGNEPARLEVLGWSSWAGLHQRQLCQMIKTTWDWLDDQWGVPEQAAAFKKYVDERFSKLRLLPLVNLEHAADANSRRAFETRVQAVIEAHPDWVPFCFWLNAAPPTSDQPVRRKNVAPPVFAKWSWFNPVLPIGTLYDCVWREKNSLTAFPNAELEQLKAIAPYNHAVLYHQLQREKKNRPTADETAAQFESVAGYDTWSMQVVANAWKADPDRYEAAFLPICRFSPDLYIQLGDYLVEQHRPEAAARAYQNAVDHAPDRIYVSNSVRWLVDYYYEQNRRKEAFAVAEMAAEVYSHQGLETMAILLERDGQLSQAETYFRKIGERYDNWGSAVLFYGRHRNGNAEFGSAFDRLIVKIFPVGQEAVDLATMSAAPTEGIVLRGTNRVISEAGLKQGDVIVAINGVRVQNKKQYFYLMDGAKSPEVQLGVWSAQKYRSFAVNLPERRLGVTIADLPLQAQR